LSRTRLGGVPPGYAPHVTTTAARRFAELARSAESCTACDLYKNATQVVFGEGPVPANLMLLGEQPGDREDREGHPFVGPAGALLERASEDAGLDLGQAYVTNAVKHFKWERSGKVRIHKKPNAAEVRACRPWWEAELQVVRPKVLVCLGATAAQAVLGPSFRVTRERGHFIPLDIPDPPDIDVVATVHPSAVLRARDEDRRVQYDAFVRDLHLVAEHLHHDRAGA
jgi:uracil-DNA glycosylase family protein